jgi:hypothetical protein
VERAEAAAQPQLRAAPAPLVLVVVAGAALRVAPILPAWEVLEVPGLNMTPRTAAAEAPVVGEAMKELPMPQVRVTQAGIMAAAAVPAG